MVSVARPPFCPPRSTLPLTRAHRRLSRSTPLSPAPSVPPSFPARELRFRRRRQHPQWAPKRDATLQERPRTDGAFVSAARGSSQIRVFIRPTLAITGRNRKLWTLEGRVPPVTPPTSSTLSPTQQRIPSFPRCLRHRPRTHSPRTSHHDIQPRTTPYPPRPRYCHRFARFTVSAYPTREPARRVRLPRPRCTLYAGGAIHLPATDGHVVS
ncbi:hypothetical protein HYPSUDRAFT_638713 [Hypholoma sublateritium FD-334 SS-4]|uniref:Uncharacterized protein n=1 Tax=Hypholoma sublateritium (strain FD-334 SS-4) TaxID=945553 RepID=A0A0D2NVE9_HYPSF|nr:hypothetical protein HYPSUDRAFT_638713 [Hypholoma sublateritium FD-334 SS-4]